MKEKYGIVVLALLASFLQAGELRVGVIDMDRIYRDSAPAQRAAKKFDKEFETRKNDLQRLSAQGKTLQNVLDKGKLPEPELKAKERELIKITQDFERMQRELNEDMNVRRHEEMTLILERAKQAIRQITEGERFDLIFSERDIPYYSPRLDVTDKVLKVLAEK